MQTDLRGRIGHTPLSAQKGLLPIFEAVVNSIQAIEDRGDGVKAGKVIVRILRNEPPADMFSKARPEPINGFEIEDDGVGFNEDNYKSFCTADSTFKETKGGKGVGRFLWLKAFEKVEISSTYQQGGQYLTRAFTFDLRNEVSNNEPHQAAKAEPHTVVKLVGFKPYYRDEVLKRTGKIAQRILEHCLPYFLTDAAPNITVIDGEETVSLNEHFSETILGTADTVEFMLKNKAFKFIQLTLQSHGGNEHSLHYCANNREVEDESLGKHMPDLEHILTDTEGRNFVFAGYLFSDYLDRTVNAERTEFRIVKEKSSTEITNDVSWEEIRNACVGKAEKFLHPHMGPVAEQKRERIEKYVKEVNPRYRPLIKHHPEVMESIPPRISDAELDVALYRADRRVEEDLKVQSAELMKKNVTNWDEYREKFKTLVDRITDHERAILADYIIHRKSILDLLRETLKKGQDGKYSKEDEIHDIIFPRHSTSDDIDVDKNSLWIIDEKLTFHKFLASDQSLAKNEVVSSDSTLRPDILLFNLPHENTAPYSSVVIVEFKRPMRDDYRKDDNPIKQVYDYIKRIKKDAELDKEGRPITLHHNAPFYCYIICDLTQTMRTIAIDESFVEAPDRSGYFYYHPNHKAYIEIISFDKLVGDSEKRNKALFEKLHL